MNILSRLYSKPRSFTGQLLTTGLSVWLLGVAFSPTLAATPTQSPVVDQSPLIIQKPLPPNITLMLDDSGSMNWDVMPDYASLGGPSNEDLINSDINGVYYNPTVTYVIPPKAEGGFYTKANFDTAWVNGFAAGDAVDLSAYRGAYDSYDTNYVGTPVQYSISVADARGTNYTPRSSCPRNTSLSGGAQPGYCAFNDRNNAPKDAFNFFDVGNKYFYVSRCSSVEDVYTYSKSGGACVHGRSFFTYTTTNSRGGNTRHYVAKKAGDCNAAGLSSVVCQETAAERQNAANWFSYYHTRMLMAKSGLLNAFSTIDPLFRIGFGSINGNNDSNLPKLNDKYGGNKIANVAPFGDGSSGTQKANFWNWVAGSYGNNGTPLPGSLDAVGTYYQSAQPWRTSSSDDTELACRQSYTILTTDGFWNGGVPNVGNVDNTKTKAITGPTNQPFTYTPASPYSDSVFNTLADVAMKYWVSDLRTSTSNEVPTNKADPAFWQHMVTFTLGLGFSPVDGKGTNSTSDDVLLPSADAIFEWANGGSPIPGFSWPTPSADNINNIADLMHAAVNGHGGFASAKTPDEFSQALKKALQRATERVGTGASLAANSTQLKTGAFAYQANYYTGSWKGDLKAIAVDPNKGTLAQTSTWSATAELPAASSRKIYTYKSGAGSVLFKTTASLSTGMLNALGGDATAQQNMIDYLRGDASMEIGKTGGVFRARETPLGDIVDSQPVYSGAPNANQFTGQSFTGTSAFAAYAATNRQGLIFVAANDGMLHAFNANTGAETYAYLPAAVITSGLKVIADPDYGTSTSVPHQFFNDGELTVADVYFGSAWHTVLVGTTGRGVARAVYALDVTNPANISLLWERSAADGKAGADSIGQMAGKPVIAQTADGTWSVLMGNGYNSTNGKAALLQFAVTDGALSVHATDSATGNGLAAPGVWIGDLTSGISTIAYAGDVQGRVWSFGLSATTSKGTNLFTTKIGTETAQSITGGILVRKNPLTQDLWVFFGTGRYLSTDDLASTATQTWYGLIVDSSTAGLAVDGTKRRTSLVQRSIIAETPGTAEVLDADGNVIAAAIAPARAVTLLPTPSDMTGKSGWYIDLLSPISATAANGNVTYTPNQVAQGERIVTPVQFQSNQLLASTRIPEATDLCNPSGRGFILAVDPFTGTNPKESFFDLNGDGLINQPSDYILVNGVPVATSGIGFSSLPNNPIFIGGNMLVSFDNGSTKTVRTPGTFNGLQRVSWRELIAQ